MKTVVDSAYNTNNTWLGFCGDITKLMDILKKNLFHAYSVERVINYIPGTQSNHCPFPPLPLFHFKLPYIGHFSVIT